MSGQLRLRNPALLIGRNYINGEWLGSIVIFCGSLNDSRYAPAHKCLPHKTGDDVKGSACGTQFERSLVHVLNALMHDFRAS